MLGNKGFWESCYINLVFQVSYNFIRLTLNERDTVLGNYFIVLFIAENSCTMVQINFLSIAAVTSPLSDCNVNKYLFLFRKLRICLFFNLVSGWLYFTMFEVTRKLVITLVTLAVEGKLNLNPKTKKTLQIRRMFMLMPSNRVLPVCIGHSLSMLWLIPKLFSYF